MDASLLREAYMVYHGRERMLAIVLAGLLAAMAPNAFATQNVTLNSVLVDAPEKGGIPREILSQSLELSLTRRYHKHNCRPIMQRSFTNME